MRVLAATTPGRNQERPAALALCAAGLLAIAIVIDRLAFASRHQRGLINSDSLYTYAWLRDMLLDREGFFWWGPPNPFFVPDAVIYLPTMLLTSDVGLQLLLYSIAYLLLLLVALATLFWHLVRSRSVALLYAAVSLAALSLFPDLLPMYQQQVPLPNVHGGALLAGVLFLALFGETLFGREGRASTRVSLVILAALAGASNLIFPVQFFAPAVASAAVLAVGGLVARARLMRCAFDACVAAVLATMLRWLFEAFGVFTFSRAPWNGSIENILKSIVVLRSEWIPLMAEQLQAAGLTLVLIWIVFSVCVLAGMGRAVPKDQPVDADAREWGRRLLFVVVSANAVMLASIAAPVLTAVWAHGVSPRYVWPFPLLGFLLLPPLVFAMLGLHWRWTAPTVGGVGILLAFLVAARAMPDIDIQRLRFEPDATGMRLLQLKRSGEVSSGLGEYWSARLLTVMTRHEILVNPVAADLGPELWLANSSRFFARGGSPSPRYDFIVTNKLNTDLIAQAFGAPARVEKAGEHEVWIYGRPIGENIPERACRTALELGAKCPLLDAGFELLATMNVGDAGTRSGRFVAPAAGRSGTMVFGPYVRLPTGRYEVTWRFADSTESVPRRFLVYSRWGQNIVHDVRNSPADSGGVLHAEFEVTPDRGGDRWEFPVVNEQPVEAALTSVRLKRLK